MNGFNRKSGRGLATAIAAAAITLGASLPVLANADVSIQEFQGPDRIVVQTTDQGLLTDSPVYGSLGRVDYMHHTFHFWTGNDHQYHVDATRAQVFIDGQPAAFRALPPHGQVTIVGHFLPDHTFVAAEVRFHDPAMSTIPGQ